MPRFGSLFSKINEKLEEAKISDLNHELGKWVQGSHALVDNFKADAANVGSILKSESNRIGGRFFGSGNKAKGVPKSLSLPSFSSALNQPPLDEHRRKYRYKSSHKTQQPTQDSFFDEIDEGLLRGEGSDDSSPPNKSEVVEKFIKVIESKDSRGSVSQPPPTTTKREDIRKKLAGGFGETPLESVKKPKKPGDLEVCYINETILEDEEYEYEEDYRSCSIPRSKTDWEVFKALDDSVEDQPYSSANSSPSPLETDTYYSDLQSEAALALTNCHKIARRKFLIVKQKELKSEENKLEKLLGKRLTQDKFTSESLCQLNTPTLQVIVNDLHSKIEHLNEQLVHLVIEKDELQIEQDSQLVDIDDLQIPQRRV